MARKTTNVFKLPSIFYRIDFIESIAIKTFKIKKLAVVKKIKAKKKTNYRARLH